MIQVPKENIGEFLFTIGMKRISNYDSNKENEFYYIKIKNHFSWPKKHHKLSQNTAK